ncbi:MAG: lysylphosphatidylglycerol synthase transmembrane domain-containing protein [Candidatus Promineifilaceae bacterium]|nr:lysylphosphatidylglycerol synthase transmembrane domain-containing protein [Candidatus Promineifilaceae bacterium]
MLKSSSTSKKVQFWVGIAVSVVSLAALLLIIDPTAIAAALRAADYRFAFLSVVGILIFLMLRAVRWRFMLENEIAWSRVFHIQNIGYMLTQLLPFRVGDVARAVLIGNVPPITLPQGLSSMVVERVLDLLLIVTLLPLALAQIGTVPAEIRSVAQIAGLAAVAATLVLIIAANQRALALRLTAAVLARLTFLDSETWTRRAYQLLRGLSSLENLRSALVLILFSVIVWLPIIFSYHLMLIAVQLQPTVAMSAFIVSVAGLSIAAPSSPGHIGVFHAAVTFALVQILGQPEAPSASFAFLHHAANVLSSVLLGLIGVNRIGATVGRVIASTRALRQEVR